MVLYNLRPELQKSDAKGCNDDHHDDEMEEEEEKKPTPTRDGKSIYDGIKIKPLSGGMHGVKHSISMEHYTQVYKQIKSSASCSFDQIESITFGGVSSRFWLFRKHLNSMKQNDSDNKKENKTPFYAWNCLSI